MTFVRHEQINSKDIYVVQKHHHALIPWSKVRGKVGNRLIVISLDHHTDTYPAFHNYAYLESNGNRLKKEELQAKLLAEFNHKSLKSIEQSIHRLKHDEHINCATMGGIIDYAFIIQLSDSQGCLVNEIPSDNIFTVGTLCVPWCTKRPHTDDCIPNLYNNVLEDSFLSKKLNEANELARCVGISDILSESYILDIDLDYFHSRRAASPIKNSVFKRMFKQARAITIALEAECVDELAMAGENISAEYLLQEILNLINT